VINIVAYTAIVMALVFSVMAIFHCILLVKSTKPYKFYTIYLRASLTVPEGNLLKSLLSNQPLIHVIVKQGYVFITRKRMLADPLECIPAGEDIPVLKGTFSEIVNWLLTLPETAVFISDTTYTASEPFIQE
jgi:hypothetical protein